MSAPISPIDDEFRRRRLAATLPMQAAAASTSAVPAPPKAAVATPKAPASPKLSKLTGDIAGGAFFGANIGEILVSGGRTHPRYYLWLLGGIDQYFLPGAMPKLLKEGPVADAVGFVATLSLTGSAAANLPGAVAQFQQNLGAARGAGAVVSALTTAAPPSPALAGSPFNLLNVCYSIAVPTMALSAVATTGEYLAEHGAHKLVSSQGGRAALLGAIAGVGFAAQLFLGGTPLSTFGWVLGSAAQTVADVNRRGWMGTDPKPAPAAK